MNGNPFMGIQKSFEAGRPFHDAVSLSLFQRGKLGVVLYFLNLYYFIHFSTFWFLFFFSTYFCCWNMTKSTHIYRETMWRLMIDTALEESNIHPSSHHYCTWFKSNNLFIWDVECWTLFYNICCF